jgi:hypothetical protein
MEINTSCSHFNLIKIRCLLYLYVLLFLWWYYCLLLREQLSCSVIWWRIEPEQTWRELYTEPVNTIGKPFLREKIICLLWRSDSMATVVLIKQRQYNTCILNIPFQLICRIILICIVLGEHPFQYMFRK